MNNENVNTGYLSCLSASSGRLEFRTYNGWRHVAVFIFFAITGFLMYGHVTHGEFQFDDEPNITKCPAVHMQTLSLESLRKAVFESKAPNRVLVSLSFAFQYWLAGGLVEWHFHVFNIFVHLCAGFAIYLLFLHLLQLPALRNRFSADAWIIALSGATLWYCNPLQTQAVSYIVQRAVSMATLFYTLSLLLYLRALSQDEDHDFERMSQFTAALFFGLCSVFSKEIGVTLPLALLTLEALLIRPVFSEAGKRLLLLCVISVLVFCAGTLWFYGRSEAGLSVKKAAVGVSDDLVEKVLRDKVLNRKIKITPRQRVLTEARVLAMYQSLFLAPAPWRLNLDYDFPESTAVFAPGDYDSLSQWAPLLLLVAIVIAVSVSPRRHRAKYFLLILLALALLETLSDLAGLDNPLALSKVWRNPWPLPALAWHFAALGVAALYAYRRPLLAFGIILFYLGHLLESSILCLEVVYEHRMYLPSLGLALVFVLLLHEAFYPARENELGAPPF
jgi:hypothetical protein